MIQTVNVYVGYDPRQPVAFQVLCHSIWKHSTKPVSITRLQLNQLPITRRGLTEFTYSRFLVPCLSGFQGISVFMDSDMLCRSDISVLVDDALEKDHPVFVVKNKKRFEWPSLMVFKNYQCQKLTPEFVEDTNHKLFDFAWASSVGELSPEWNHLVGYDEPQDAKVIHFTQGIPCWPETEHCEYAQDWINGAKESLSTVSWKALMGHSVHAAPVLQRIQG